MKTANVFVRMEPELKKDAEEILNELGLPVSNAITLFYKQIIEHQGLPFSITLNNNPLNNSKVIKYIDQEISNLEEHPFIKHEENSDKKIFISESQNSYNK